MGSFLTFQINLESGNNEQYFAFPLFSFFLHSYSELLRMIKRFQVDNEAELKDIKLKLQKEYSMQSQKSLFLVSPKSINKLQLGR